MQKLPLLLILTMSLIAGCKSTTVLVDTSCYWVKPITTTAAERKVMSRDTKEQIATHNDLYDQKCGQAMKSE
jgi:hypothetical protein